MKKILLICSLLILCLTSITAQETIYERRGHGLYVEVLGNSFSYALTYESRFTDRNGGIGGRVGIGYMSVNDGTCLSIPVLVNYLLGKKEGKHFLELGAGISYLDFKNVTDITVNDESIFFEGKIYGSFAIMYQRNPPYGGFLWKIGYTPLIGDFNDSRSVLHSLGMGFGYAF